MIGSNKNMDKYLLSELEDNIFDTVTSYINEHELIEAPVILSGGFDSGLLAAITGSKRGYRMRFEYGSKFDETKYARAIAKHLDIQLVEVDITPEIFQQNFEEAVKIWGEVTPHFSLVPLYILMKTLKEFGETDVLSGEGPDEYLGGYARQIIFDELKKLYKIPELRNYHRMIDRVLGFQYDSEDLLAEEYARLLGYPKDKVIDFIYKQEEQYPFQGLIGKMDMELGHIEDMEQKLAKHFGINFHYPYINEKLAEYCYQLPDEMKIKDGRTKVAFKEIAMKYLPEIMRDRNKLGGPVAPVNKFLGCEDTMGDFGKEKYIEAQKKILNIK